MKKCQYCDENIQEDAKKCRYCGEWLEEKEKNRKSKKNGDPVEIIDDVIEEKNEFNEVKPKLEKNNNNIKKIVGVVVFIILFSYFGGYESDISINNTGMDYYKNKQYEKALENFNKAIEKKPESLYYSNRCLANNKLGNKNEALSDCKTAYQGIKNNTQKDHIEKIYLNYSTVLIESGENEKGKLIIEEGISNGIDDGALFLNLGYYYLIKGSYDQAIFNIKKGINMGLEDEYYSIGYSNLALAYIEKGELEEGLKSIEEGYKYNPHDSGLIANHGYYYLSKGDYDKSENYYIKAYNIDKKAELVISNLSFLSLVKGDYVEANKYIKEAKEIGDNDSQTKMIEYLVGYWENDKSIIRREEYINKLEESSGMELSDYDLYVMNIMYQSLDGVVSSTNENKIFENIIDKTDELIDNGKFELFSLRLNIYCKVIIDQTTEEEYYEQLQKIYSLDKNYDYEEDFTNIEESINKSYEIALTL